MVIGRIDQLVDESAARGRIAALHLDINFWDTRPKGNLIRPAAVELGITERIGWHTFRHLFITAKGNRSGHQGDAKTASARLQSSHIRTGIPKRSRITNAKLKVMSFDCSVVLVLGAAEPKSLLL
jgi:hypothetical protein